MDDHLLGQTFSLLCAIAWAFALVLFKRAGERIPPVALNLFKNCIGLILLVATLAVLTVLGIDGFESVRQRPPRDWAILMLSGVIGIALADTILFHALNLIGVGLFSIVDCAYAPFAVLFAWLLLAEQLTLVHYAGGALILVGVLIASRHDPPPGRTRRQIIAGMLLALLAVALMAFGIVIAKPVLKDFPLLWATTVRLLAGSALLVLFSLATNGGTRHWGVFRSSVSWKFAVPGAVLGMYVSLILWMAGFKYTYASIAAVLNQTSVVFSCVLAALVLKETFDARKIMALVLAVVGVVVVTLADWLQATCGNWLVLQR